MGSIRAGGLLLASSLLLTACTAGGPTAAAPSTPVEPLPGAVVPTAVEPSPVAASTISLERAFPALQFKSPTDLQAPHDGSDRLFVAEQSGVIRVFPNDQAVPVSTVFLDIKSRVDQDESGRGLLGFAFDPDYRKNGAFYVYYTAVNPLRSILSRFRASATSPNQADPQSEEILLSFDQPFANHKGGQVAFGSDGMLYLTSGDGGGGPAPNNGQKNGQDLTTLLGKFIRIDVRRSEKGLPYAIPVDNPFAGNQQGFRQEIYAYGLRNPWRAAFDPETGRWFGGDVGQKSNEEINLLDKGKNYGWALMEGDVCFEGKPCDTRGLTLPIATYGRDLGQSVTGGYVYRGKRVPALQGAYVYADYVSGRFWQLRYDGQRVTQNDVFLKNHVSVTTFGMDEQRELYALDALGRLHWFK